MKNFKSHFSASLFAGLNGFIVFGVYGIFVSPQLSKTIEFHEINIPLAVVGFIMLLLEPFAVFNKLKNARIRSVLKRRYVKEKTGIDHVPYTSKLILFGFFARVLLRASAVGVCTTALGLHNADDKHADPAAVWILLIFLFMDFCAIAFIYMKTDFFTETYHNEREKQFLQKAYEAWNQKHIPGYFTTRSYWKELIADVVLQVYSVMLVTAFIDYTNNYGLNDVRKRVEAGYSALEASNSLMIMFLFLLVGALMPLRIAYWVEDSLLAFTRKEKAGLWVMFSIVVLFFFSPWFITYQINFGGHGEGVTNFLASIWSNVLIAVLFLFVVTVLRLKIFKQDYSENSGIIENN